MESKAFKHEAGQSGRDIDGKTKQEPRYPEDYSFVQSLIENEPKTWERFQKELERKIRSFLNGRYLGIFSDTDADEIYIHVIERLTQKRTQKKWNPVVLKRYRGECTFSQYVTRQVEWAVKEWLRRHGEGIVYSPIPPVSDRAECNERPYPDEVDNVIIQDGSIPDYIISLNDDVRWTFLLWSFDLFGFPVREREKLAQKRGVSVREIDAIIERFFETTKYDVLARKREERGKHMERLSRDLSKIQDLKKTSNKINDKIGRALVSGNKAELLLRQESLGEVSEKIIALTTKCDETKKELLKLITTPYTIIGMILGETNENTLRSRIAIAKKQIEQNRKYGKQLHNKQNKDTEKGV